MTARPVITATFMREKGSSPVISPGSSGKGNGFTTQRASHLLLPFKNHNHRDRRSCPAVKTYLPP